MNLIPNSFAPSNFAIDKRKAMYVLIILSIFFGFSSYGDLPRERNPDIQIPLLIVIAPFPAATPTDVESLVTRKLETEFQAISGIKSIKSTSRRGVSEVTLEFNLGFDIQEAKQRLRDAIDKAEVDMPSEVESITIVEINLSQSDILSFTLSGNYDLERLRGFAEELQEDLEGVNGVLEVNLFGGPIREVFVEVDPKRLQFYGLSINQVVSAVRDNNRNVSAGAMEIGNMSYSVRVPGEISDTLELEDFIVSSNGAEVIYLRDVADVRFALKDLANKSRVDGEESVSLSVRKRTGKNVSQVTDGLKAVIAQYEQRWGDDINIVVLYDASVNVNKMVENLENNIIVGFFFVVLVLWLVMGFWNAFLVGISIPLSMLLSFVILRAFGITLNVVVLFSLVLALGMLVDTGIVIIENIYRHIQLGKSRIEAAKTGVAEVAFPVISSTMTTLGAFLPLFFMPDIMGEFMSYIPKVLTITLSCSLIVGVFFNSSVCAGLMRVPRGLRSLSNEERIAASRLLRVYGAILDRCLRQKTLLIIGVLALWGGVLGYYGSLGLGVEFFPRGEPESATMKLNLPYGTTLDAADSQVARVEELVTSIAEDNSDTIISKVNSGRGRGGGADYFRSSIQIIFPDWEERQEKPTAVMNELRESMENNKLDFPGILYSLERPSNGPPVGGAINIEIKGSDFSSMKQVSLQIQEFIAGLEGAVNVEDDYLSSRSDIVVDIDRKKAALLNLDVPTVSRLIRTALYGSEASTYRDAKEDYPITVKLKDTFLKDYQDLAELTFQTRLGQSVKLGQIARIYSEQASPSIRRIDGSRVITVSGDVEGVPGPVVLEKIKAAVATMDIPPDIDIAYTGEDSSRRESQAYLIQSFVVALLIIFFVLVVQFNSMIIPLMILTSVVLSLIGVFTGLIIHQKPFSVIVGGIGVISLAGVVVNNSIVLLDYISNLRRNGLEYKQAIIQACQTRLRPVLLTATTTVLGLMPVALLMDVNVFRGVEAAQVAYATAPSLWAALLAFWDRFVLFGSEGGTIWLPMSLAIIYGLSIATFLTLFVLPTIYCAGVEVKRFFGALWSRIFRKKKVSPPSPPQTA